MQIYFGAVPQDEVFDSDAMFVSDKDDDNYFYYGIEFGSNPGGREEVLVYDGLDRCVPVDIESVPAMIKALETAYMLHTATINAQNFLESMDALMEADDETVTVSPVL
jgi:hypothetical protein